MTTMPRSSVPGVLWPAIVSGEGSTLLAAAFQLERSQWWTPPELETRQYEQLSVLVRHARESVPWYRRRLQEISWKPGKALTPERWREIPLLTKDDIRRHHADLLSRRALPGHRETHRNKTSGSSGEPIEIVCTEVTGFFWDALAFRDDLWHRRDLGGRLVAIRSGREAEDPLAVCDLRHWGLLPPHVCKTGPATILYHLTPISRQAAILEARSPHYLLTYPSNARSLCQHARRRPMRLPDLEAVHTYGEPLTPDVRAACREVWGVPVHDVYSCEEVGFVALECPLHEHYHVQSESVLVEILDERGSPCLPGQIGRVVVTALHNFAMPLIRYAIGDYAEVGAPCSCGRGLPVLTKILGRSRNRVTLPDGTKAWPDVAALWAAIPEVEQIQLVQRGANDIEVRFAPARRFSPEEQETITARIWEALGHPFQLTFSGLSAILRHENGKYETFIDARCP
jgi:phenylacetate-CoA ligase